MEDLRSKSGSPGSGPWNTEPVADFRHHASTSRIPHTSGVTDRAGERTLANPPMTLLGRAIECAGSATGSQALLDFVQSVIPFTTCLVTVMFRVRPPTLLYHDIAAHRRRIVVDAYLQGAYLLDPFFDYLARGPRESIVRLRDIQPDHFRKSEFYCSYYADARLNDEIALFVERPDQSHVFLSLGRAQGTGTFSGRDFERLRQFQPVIESLVLRHWGVYFAAGNEQRAEVVPTTHQGLDQVLTRGLFGSLSAREREIVALILKGYSSKSIARGLGIAVGTVKNHRKHIYRKLSITSQAGLFACFLHLIGFERWNLDHDKKAATPHP